MLNAYFETRIAFDKECCFLQEIYKDVYIMRSSNFEKQGKTEIGLQLVTRVVYSFLKIGVTQTIFSLSGKTPFA